MTELGIRINRKLTRWLWNAMGMVFGVALLAALLVSLVWKIG